MEDQHLHQMIEFLHATPDAVRQLIASLSEAEMRSKPSEDEFSALEQVCHLRDIEREGFAVRIERLLMEDQPLLPDLDGSRLAIERDYNRQDFAMALIEFSQARLKNVDRLRTVSPTKLERSGELQGVGTITLAKLLDLMHEHDQSHLDELRILSERLNRQRSVDDGSSATDLHVR